MSRVVPLSRGRRGRGGGLLFWGSSERRFVGLVMGRMRRHKGRTGGICGEGKVCGEGVGTRDIITSREN